MTAQSHAAVMGMVAAQRVADFQAEAERYRLERVAEMHTDRRQVWPGLVVLAIALVLALLAAGLALGVTQTIGATPL